MAFRDQIRKYKLGTGMAQSSSEELQSLTSKAERPIAPSSPLEASVIGASPDVAKMTGTPNQKQSALRVAIQQDKNLSDAQRTDQARQAQTGQEQSAAAKGQKAQSLNSLNDRVQNLTNQMLQTAQSNTVAQMQVNQDALSSFGTDPAQQQEAQALLNKLGTNQANNQDILRINQLMGRTNIDGQLSADDLKANFLTQGQAAGQSLAGATADQMLVSDLDPTQLGFTDNNELAAMLGIPPEELSGMNLKQLQDQAQTLFNDEFNKVGALEQQANDINLGPAERAEARKQLKDMGAVGVRKSENQIDKLADQVANSDVVSFAGEELKVKDVLSDEYLSGLAARYVDADENDPFIKELRESEPELSKWLDDNKEILKQATQDLDEDVKTFSDLQFQNQKLKTFPDLPNLDDDMMKSILPDWGELRADAYNIDEVPALKMLQDSSIPQVTRANVRNSFDQFNASAPQLVGQLARLSPAQLDQLGASASPGNTKWQAVQSYLKDVSNINSVNADQPDTIASYILGSGKTAADLTKTSLGVKSRANSGLFGSSPISEEFQNILNTNDPTKIAEYLKQNFASPTNISNLVNSVPFSASQSGQNANSYSTQTNELFNITEKYFNNNSMLDLGNITDLAKTPMNLEKVYNSQLSQKMNPDALANVGRLFKENYSPVYSDKLVQSKFYSLPSLKAEMEKAPGSNSIEDVMKMYGTVNQMKSELKAMNKSKTPMQYDFLEKQIKDVERKVQKHYDTAIDEMLEVIALGEPKDSEKMLKKALDQGSPGMSNAAGHIARAFGLNDEKMLSKAANMIGKRNLGFIQQLNSLDLSGNAIKELNRTLTKIFKGQPESRIADAIGNAGGKVSDSVKNALSKATVASCFVKDEKFILEDCSIKAVQDLSPNDILLMGGRTFCTAQFISYEIYEYNKIKVAGSHAVLEGNTWVRVRDSEVAKRCPELDGSMVYVVWNENHRMVHESGTIFTDYAETSEADERISEMKNINKLNNIDRFVI